MIRPTGMHMEKSPQFQAVGSEEMVGSRREEVEEEEGRRRKRRSILCSIFLLCCAGALQGILVNGLINVVISTIEKRLV